MQPPPFFPQPEKKFSYRKNHLILWSVLIVIAALMRIMEIPGRGLIICISTGGFAAFNLASIILLKGQSNLNNFMFGLAFLWSGIIAADNLTGLQYITGGDGAFLYIGILLFTLITYLIAFRKYLASFV